MRKVISHILTELGYLDIAEAKDGYQALLMVKKNHYDLVLTDWNMPNMSGFELLKNIRRTPEIKDTVVLLVTTEHDKIQVMEAVKAGVNSFIVKPFSSEELEKKMKLMFPKN